MFINLPDERLVFRDPNGSADMAKTSSSGGRADSGGLNVAQSVYQPRDEAGVEAISRAGAIHNLVSDRGDEGGFFFTRHKAAARSELEHYTPRTFGAQFANNL